jgi:hypothetical protein
MNSSIRQFGQEWRLFPPQIVLALRHQFSEKGDVEKPILQARTVALATPEWRGSTSMISWEDLQANVIGGQ